MKILKLRFENLNSLYGSWEIDFNSPDLADSLFLITGSTGAGKTTILDAVCLALYGRTPRLKSLSDSQNEIMSTQASDCQAQVDFSCATGDYRVTWSQKRTRSGSKKNFSPIKRTLASLPDEKVLEEKSKDVLAVVAAKTGMDFEHFTRSIMLAQGSFAAFLKAGVEERSAMLEQLSGTEIYTQLSLLVHERKALANKQVSDLNLSLSGISLLSAEELKDLRQELEAERQSLVEVNADKAQREAVSKSLQEWQECQKLERDLLAEAAELKLSEKDYGKNFAHLQEAKKAIQIKATYEQEKILANNQKSLSSDLAALEKSLPEESANKIKAKGALVLVEKSFTIEKLSWEKQTKSLHQAESLLAEKHQVALKYSGVSREIKALVISLKGLDQSLLSQGQWQDQLKSLEAQSKGLAIDTYAKTEGHGEAYFVEQEQSFTHRLEQGRALELLLENLLVQKQEQEKNQKELVELKKKLTPLEKEAVAQVKLVEEMAKRLNELNRSQRLAEKLRSFEEHRQHLEDDKECPLCGSLEHPWASDEPEIENLEKDIKELELSLAQEQQKNDKLKKDLAQLVAKNEWLEDLVAKLLEASLAQEEKLNQQLTVVLNLGSGIKASPEDLLQLRKELADELKALGLGKIFYTQRLSDWRQVEKSLQDTKLNLAKLDALVVKKSECQKNKTKLENDLFELETEGKEQKSQLDEILGKQNLAEAQESLLHARAKAEKNLKSVQHVAQEAEKNLLSCQTKIAEKKNALKRNETDLLNVQSQWQKEMQLANFKTEADFLQSLLDSTAFETLEKKVKDFEQAKAIWQERNKTCEERKAGSQLSDEVKKKSDVEILAELATVKEKLDSLEGVITTRNQNLGVLSEKLARQEENQKRVEAQLGAIQKAEAELKRWGDLHELIGSSDGKKFRNFAQGLSFEILLHHANEQLQKMSDRYLLFQEIDKPLEIAVVDAYQAGEIRSSINLSGGESFIVSLSLALGMSEMNSKSMKLESLFLDEGFGTLGEEDLEIALNALSQIQASGKSIGIISHVSALKDCISSQIHVQKGSNGRSQLSGSGVMISERSGL